jgi:proline iminopeptidase
MGRFSVSRDSLLRKNFKKMNRTKLFLPAIIVWLMLSGCQKELLVNQDGNLVPKTVDQDVMLHSIFINGTQLHAETFGNPDSPMLVILHGGPGADYRYLLNCEEFAEHGYYVIFYDQRGSGLSKRESKGSYTLQLMFDDLSGIIAHYRTSADQKVILLGHSWGAMLATAYINQNHAAIDGAILCEPGGFKWQDIMDYVSRERDFGITTETLNDATYLDQFITGGENDHAILDYKLGLLAYTDGAPDSKLGNDGVLPFWRYGAIVNRALFELGEKDEPDWTTNLQSFATKVLFCYSERNQAYGLEHAQKVSSAYPNVELERIDDAGHDMITFPDGWNNFFPIALNYLNTL